MNELFKKILKVAGWVILSLILLVFGIISAFSSISSIGSLWNFVVRAVTAIGGGNPTVGVVILPFAIFGFVQFARGAIKVIEEDSMAMGDHILRGVLYVLATVVGYMAMFVAAYLI